MNIELIKPYGYCAGVQRVLDILKDIADITYQSREQIKTIKESCIIKLGLVFDVCVKATDR
mgnify:CR=1 FL=1